MVLKFAQTQETRSLVPKKNPTQTPPHIFFSPTRWKGDSSLLLPLFNTIIISIYLRESVTVFMLKKS